MITGYLNGHKIIWNDKIQWWLYEDGTNTDIIRKCPRCEKLPTKDGHDACMANLPGVKNACCGHGVEPGYIQFTDNRVYRFPLIKLSQ